MKRVLTFGGAMYDIFIEYQQSQSIQLHLTSGSSSFLVLPEGKKIELNKLSYHIGGGAVNSAVSFSRQGQVVQSVIKVGTDQAGKFIVHNLAQNGVNTEFVIHSDTSETGTSFIIPCSSGDRTILIYRGANTTIQEYEFAHTAFDGIDQLYVTSLAGTSAQLVPTILAQAKDASIATAVNPGTTQLTTAVSTLITALPYIDTLILNAHEATLLLQSLTLRADVENKNRPALLNQKNQNLDLKKFISCMHDHGIHIVAITNGAEGVYVSDKKTLYFHPSIPCSLVSSVGAGDAFGSTFVGSLRAGYALDEALKRGMCNSASVIGSIGATTGLLTTDQLNQRVKQLDPTLLQQFTL